MQGEKSINSENFGSRLRKLRKHKGLTQAQLAKKIGYKRSGSVSNIENNKTPPDIQSLAKLGDLLDADLHWLITGCVPAAIKRLKPFVQIHLADIEQKILTKRRDRSNLMISDVAGGVYSVQLQSVDDEIKELKMHCKAIRDSVNEVLTPYGESL